ncbi:hypothetical protein SVAN01_05313 [Stagonosporopsis vannaccii]|nr:hypothetical protein SVAN01_05313 [Stagonosporopsis vannaccii]
MPSRSHLHDVLALQYSVVYSAMKPALALIGILVIVSVREVETLEIQMHQCNFRRVGTATQIQEKPGAWTCTRIWKLGRHDRQLVLELQRIRIAGSPHNVRNLSLPSGLERHRLAEGANCVQRLSYVGDLCSSWTSEAKAIIDSMRNFGQARIQATHHVADAQNFAIPSRVWCWRKTVKHRCTVSATDRYFFTECLENACNDGMIPPNCGDTGVTWVVAMVAAMYVVPQLKAAGRHSSLPRLTDATDNKDDLT